MGGGIYLGGAIASLLLILTKILFALFVIGLVGGLVVWIKYNIFTAEERQVIKGTFTGSCSKKEVCRECGKELRAEWKACPYCSTSKEKVEVVNA